MLYLSDYQPVRGPPRVDRRVRPIDLESPRPGAGPPTASLPPGATGEPGGRHRVRGRQKRKRTKGKKSTNTVLSAAQALVERGFAHLKNWRIMTKLRTDPTRATTLLCALLVLTNLKVNRRQTIKNTSGNRGHVRMR